MALYFGGPSDEWLATEVADRREAAAHQHKSVERLARFLTDEAWPQVPSEVVGKPITRAEREAILGYGPDGV